MEIETLGQCFSHSINPILHCAEGKGQAMKKHRECVYRLELDMRTLVATRGRDFPMARLAEVMRCPSCGSRRVRILWNMPGNVTSRSAAIL